jgi:hypothetical protein
MDEIFGIGEGRVNLLLHMDALQDPEEFLDGHEPFYGTSGIPFCGRGHFRVHFFERLPQLRRQVPEGIVDVYDDSLPWVF